ncbi:unnamed protein product, partial [Mesorhabditis belari]|uniref:Proton-coupled zinc antiporter SLC30A5 n=1 Tax=Mesorhabditis belari TaxID=2138241 RepID=A0AAF3ED84_9BILA
MLAHDFLKKDDRSFTPTASSRSAWYFLALVGAKLLRCIGIFFIDILSKSLHVVSLLWLFKLISSLMMIPLQKPFTTGKHLRKATLARIGRLSLWNCLIEMLWFYGITFCGPLRSVLVFELSPSVILIAIASIFKSDGSPSKTRGLFFLLIGFVSLMLMDKDSSIEDEHTKQHAHHSGLNHLFYHVIGMFGVADHQGGVVILVLALLLRIGYDSSFRHMAVELGGAKRLYSLVTLFSALILMPLGLLLIVMDTSHIDAWGSFIFLIVLATLFVTILDFYAEAICFQHVADPVMAAARWSPVTMFSCALTLALIWYSGRATHAVTGGVIVTFFAFMLGSISLTTSSTPRSRGGHFVGISDAGLPLFTHGEAFLQRTSRSMMLFFKETLREILANNDSRRIFWFLCVNLGFCGVEFMYGFWTNSLGLISDGFHMLFDCSALVMGLVASVMSRWPATKNYTYGFGRVEVLSGFINALFLCVIAMFILIEALERLFDPPNINTDKLLFVAVSGLIVNLFGMYSFHGGDGEHGHSHHGHSHGGGSHGHSHANANMEGVFLHVLADTLGSVFVIISTLLIQWFGWTWVDPLCSLILSLLILGSVYPLLTSSAKTLLQNIPDEFDEEFEYHLSEALEVDGVESYSQAHFWQLKSDLNVASVHVHVKDEANAQMIRNKVLALLKAAGATQSTVQVEKSSFNQRIQQLCPSYRVAHRVVRGTTVSRRAQNGGHGHSHSAGGHGHSHGDDGGHHGHSHGSGGGSDGGHGHSHDGQHGHSH